jgi:hypothetical protein
MVSNFKDLSKNESDQSKLQNSKTKLIPQQAHTSLLTLHLIVIFKHLKANKSTTTGNTHSQQQAIEETSKKIQ